MARAKSRWIQGAKLKKGAFLAKTFKRMAK